MKNKKTTVRTLAATFTLIGALAGGAHAAVTFQQSGNDLVMEITDPLVFTSTVTHTDVNFFGVSFEDAYSSNQPFLIEPLSPTVLVPIDSVNNATSSIFQGSSSGDISLTNISFNLMGYGSSVTISPGEVVTVPSGTYTATDYFLDANAALPDQAITSAFLWYSGANKASDSISITPVPEPSSALLVGLGGIALILRRRKA